MLRSAFNVRRSLLKQAIRVVTGATQQTDLAVANLLVSRGVTTATQHGGHRDLHINLHM